MNKAESQRAFPTKQAFLEYASRRTPIVQKEDFIVEQCRNARVLDIGCIDHSSDVALKLGDNWLHHRIAEASKSTIGLDLLEKEAKFLSGRGYDIRAGNAEDFDLGSDFDVIVAGDLIEHLTNISGFLASVRRHMRPDSVFVVTTPNPFNLEQTVRVMALNRIAVHPQHATWIDPTVAWELVTRNGFEIVDFRWVGTRFTMGHDRPKLISALLTVPLEAMMWLRPFWRRDYALVLRRAGATTVQ